MSEVRIVLVDDHAVVRAGLRTLLSTDTGLVIVGEAASQEAAIAAVLDAKPDILLADIKLGRGSGIEVCREVKRLSPATKVLLLSAYWDDRLVSEAFGAGADGYLLKQAEDLDIPGAVQLAMSGRPAIAAELLPALLRLGVGERPATGALSEREREMIALVARGFTNQAIAAEMHLSPHTVKEYVSRLLNKLGATNRTEMISIATNRGLVVAAS